MHKLLIWVVCTNILNSKKQYGIKNHVAFFILNKSNKILFILKRTSQKEQAKKNELKRTR